jgi:hypothetical protein
MLLGSFVPSERGWKALLDVGPNCSEDELMAAAHRYADRMALRHGQVVLVYEAGLTAGIARLYINLFAEVAEVEPEYVWVQITANRSVRIPVGIPVGKCLFTGPVRFVPLVDDCPCDECQEVVRERDASPTLRRPTAQPQDAITQEIPITRSATPDTLLLKETDMPGAAPIVNHMGEDIPVLTGEDRGPRTTTEDPTEDHSRTPSEPTSVGGSENPESGGEATVLYLLQGGINASMTPGPWDKKYARPIVRILALGGSMTARQIGIAIGCKTPRIVHGTLTELEADGWVRADGKTQQGHVTWTTDRDPAEMPQTEETA